jgi:hypothetical protein
VGSLVALAVTALLCASLLVLRQGLARAQIDARLKALPRLSTSQIADFLNDYRMDEPHPKRLNAAFRWRPLQ